MDLNEAKGKAIMKKLKTYFISIFIFLSACSSIHPIKLVDVKEGKTLKGEYDNNTNIVKVWMANGEVLEGIYTFNKVSSFTFDNRSNFSNTIYKNGRAYAILKGDKGTVMEIMVDVSGYSGFGEAVTNTGKRYGVQF